MKKVISMIGTSIFENYFEKEEEKTIRNFYDDLKEKRLKEYENEKERVDRLRNSIRRWIKREIEKENISAEIKSLMKLKEELKEEFENYFLCSDTILSNLAGDLIKEFLEEYLWNPKIITKTIEGLQVWDKKEFSKKGLSNLISEIYNIANGFWGNVVLNITGGYKAITPYLTILAQINNCPLYYIFENTDTLIKIPNIPFSTKWFDWDKLEEYKEWFQKLEVGITNEKDYYSLINSDFYKDYSFLVWFDEEGFAELNPIGKIIFNKFKEMIFEFYAPDEVYSIIQSDDALKNLFENQFSNKEQRENKTENKNGHFVYDAGNNQLRIFYRELENKIYIYKVFNKHDEYEKYLKFTPYS
ncbi:MAG: putative CRISPR-associated protein, partial [Dictyoglomaceae bacterium]|nr:putative CRISPR-associated protein [Dictyoglomaceae bacterium]